MTGFVTKKINRTRTLGSILKAARSKADISLEAAEAGTKIRLKYLEALESGQYQLLPAEAYNIGFVRCYAEFLKLNPEKIIRLYREERSQKRLQPTAEVNFAPVKVNEWRLLITPKVIGVFSVLVIFGGIVSYIAMQLNEFTSPPVISLIGVGDEFTSNKDKINLSGKTSEGSIITMNNEPVMVAPTGGFNQEIQLAPGVNEVVIAAKSRAGKQAQKTVKILFNPDLARAN